MTQDDKEFLKEFLRGASGVVIVVGLFILFVILLGQSQNLPVETQSTKVIGTYKECDIVRYTPDYSSKYYYFLDCSSKY